MKKLTKEEIIELRAASIFESHSPTMKWKNATDNERYYKMQEAKATIEADEKAGVLMLVDDEPEEGDFIRDVEGVKGYVDFCNSSEIIIINSEDGCIQAKKPIVIIQRNNTPVYNCKKEVTND